jgi:hypothetical protein
LIGAFNDWGSEIKFTNQNDLTMFADYRVPQILRQFDILKYSEELASLIDSETEIAYSSPYEVEIRACTVVAVELILERIRASEILKQ